MNFRRFISTSLCSQVLIMVNFNSFKSEISVILNFNLSKLYVPEVLNVQINEIYKKLTTIKSNKLRFKKVF